MRATRFLHQRPSGGLRRPGINGPQGPLYPVFDNGQVARDEFPIMWWPLPRRKALWILAKSEYTGTDVDEGPRREARIQRAPRITTL